MRGKGSWSTVTEVQISHLYPNLSFFFDTMERNLRNFSIVEKFFLKPARPSRPVDRCSLRD